MLTDGIATFNDEIENLVEQEILANFPLVADNIQIDDGFVSKLNDLLLPAVQATVSSHPTYDQAFRETLYTNLQNALGSLIVPGSLQVAPGLYPNSACASRDMMFTKPAWMSVCRAQVRGQWRWFSQSRHGL